MTTVFEESPFLIPFISLLITMVGIILGFYYFNKTNKQKSRQDSKTDALTTEQTARQKQKDEQEMAREVKETARQIAIGVKQETLDDVSNMMNDIKHSIAMQKQHIQSEMRLMQQVTGQIKIDLENHMRDEERIIERMEKSLNFVSQFLWGQGAKSIPYYVTGEEEPQEHKDQPTEGIYKEPDSSETQTMKDYADSTGFASTRTQDIKDTVEREKLKDKKEEEEKEQ